MSATLRVGMLRLPPKSLGMRRSTALALLGASPLATMPVRASAQSQPIRLGAAINDSYAEPFFAADGGFFGRAGLNIELQTFTSAPAIAQAVLGNAVDVGLADVIQIANAHIHGLPLVFFAGGGLYLSSAPTSYLCVAKNSTVRTAKDLAGQTIAVVALTSTAASTIREWLRVGGTDPASVKMFELPFASMVPALNRGAVTAAYISEPFVSQSKSDVTLIGDTQAVIAKSFYVAPYFASRDWIAANRTTASLLAKTLYDTARWANTHHNETAVILSKYSKLEVDKIKLMTRVEFATTPLDAKLIQPSLDFALKTGVLEKATNAADLMVAV